MPVMVGSKTLPAYRPTIRDHVQAVSSLIDFNWRPPSRLLFPLHVWQGGGWSIRPLKQVDLAACNFIVKHMEDLNIAYDRTVRDADGSCIRFMYGADGLGPKVSLLTGESRQMKLVALNTKALLSKHVTNTSATGGI